MQADLLDYVSRDSLVHRLDARWRLLGIAAACVAVVLLRSVASAATAFVLALIALTTARLPGSWLFARLASVAVFLAVVTLVLPVTIPGPGVDLAWVHVSYAGLHLAALISLKALSVSALVLLLFAAAPVGVTLRAAHRLGLPDLLIQLLMLTYLHAYLLADELGKLRIALRLRRFRNRMSRHTYRTLGNVAGSLLVRGYERAERVSQAMRTRGFTGQFRTLHEFHTTGADLLGAGLLAAVGFAPLLADLLAPLLPAR
ncbi:MAG: cobalt ECF transporter T component CbiQ [Gemmatales bacterium]|nr:cobalt ECF transporter T component CbiQ [Gemmatales bacterium]MDW8387032.1 cobalt ECF transporter T component CbiQ [Gemmatales bacterium]